MQKYRADTSSTQKDGATVWHAKWMGGHTLARVNNCRLENLSGEMRATVYTISEPDTYFSIPAVCKLMGKRVRGYLTRDDTGDLVFRHTYY